MKARAFAFALALALLPAFAIPQSQPAPSAPAPSVLVKAGKLLDVRKGAYIENAGIWIEGNRIKEVGRLAEVQAHAPHYTKVIDLSRATVLPGLIDCHTHLMARFASGDEGYLLAFLRSIQQAVQQARELGVKIASGYDAGNVTKQGKNADELLALTKRGLPPLEAIRAATLNAAELMSWQDRVGALEPGKYADLIAVEGDPLTDIGVLQQVEFVMKGGAVVKDSLPH
jgi:imidazolonepropionase-like amidohydrolase